MAMDDAERNARIDLAACYRLVAQNGWDDLVFTHISVRIPGSEHFLLNPFGVLFEEMTASALVKIDAQGNNIDPAISARINPAGFMIHSAVHSLREDAACVVHLHTIAGVAVSAQREGLLPISQDALRFDGAIGYHGYEGFAFEDAERDSLRNDLAGHNVLILRNHGTMTVGASVGEAYLRMYWLERACAIQIAAQAGAGAGFVVPPDEIRKKTSARNDFITKRAAPEAWAALRRKLDRLDPSYRD